MAKGWIKLHRQITDNSLYFAEPFDKLHAWIDLLMLANSKPTNTFYVGSELVTLKQGEIYTSELKLSKRWKWSRAKVHRFLNTLEIQKMCTTNRTTGGTTNGTTITLTNWAKYQGGSTTVDTTVDTTNVTTHDTTVEHNQEYIRNKKEYKKPQAAVGERYGVQREIDLDAMIIDQIINRGKVDNNEFTEQSMP